MRAFSILAVIAALAAASSGREATSKIVIYRLRGANFGLIHYSQGKTPTVSCDGVKIARIGEDRKALVSAVAGKYICIAKEQQPGAMDASSKSLSWI
jgi:hypothetical protein